MIKYSSEIKKSSGNRLISINSSGELESRYGTHIFRPNGRSDYQLIYICEGSCLVTRGREVYTAQKGDVIIYKPGEVQDYCFNSKGKNCTYYIHFTGDFCEEYFDILGLNGVLITDASQNKDIKHLFYLTCKYFNMAGKDFDACCSGLIQSILALISTEINNKHSIDGFNINTSKIHELITRLKMLPDFKMSITECAEFCNISESHFRRVFKAVIGESPTQFMTRIKIDRAKEYLLFTEESISEISQSCGFDDQNYFSRIFKKSVGLTPTDFRKNK